MLDRDRTVASVVLDHSECAEVFHRHRIDYCCRGEQSIASAAEQRGLDAADLVAELDRVIAARRPEERADPRGLTTPALVAHLASTHHADLRRGLPFLRGLAAKVAGVHGDHNRKLRGLAGAVGELADVLLSHIEDEERMLFPLLTGDTIDTARVARLFDDMVAEHLEIARLLETVRAASDDFHVPEWACRSYRTLFVELRALEADLFAHVHLENHVLRPRFSPAGAEPRPATPERKRRPCP